MFKYVWVRKEVKDNISQSGKMSSYDKSELSNQNLALPNNATSELIIPEAPVVYVEINHQENDYTVERLTVQNKQVVSGN